MQIPMTERIEKLIDKHVGVYQEDWYNHDRHVHATHPTGVLLLRRCGVEYFSGAKSYEYEKTTFDYYERDARSTKDEGRYHYYHVTEKSVRLIDVDKARQLFDAMWSKVSIEAERGEGHGRRLHVDAR